MRVDRTLATEFEKAVSYHQAGRLADAERAYRKVLTDSPSHADAIHNLGLVVQQRGNATEALKLLRQAAKLTPSSASVHYNHAVMLQTSGATSEAIEAYQRAIALRPDFAEAHNNLGSAHYQLGDRSLAIRGYRQALALKDGFSDAHANLAYALRDQSRLGDAARHFRRAVELDPRHAHGYESMLFAAACSGVFPVADFLSLARGWELFRLDSASRQAAAARRFQRAPMSSRRLRVGYVSGDFRQHAIANFVERLFKFHDKSKVELYGYSNNAQRDAVTDRIQANVDHWVPLYDLNDIEACARIEADCIDVLVDLTGHTQRSRLGVFARRAAPVQLHYLGFFGTTGLTEMDYWMGDHILTPPAMQSGFKEHLWQLPRIWVAYDGSVTAPPTAARAASSDTSLCLGSFNGIGKLTPETLVLWARVLNALPHSRLLLKAKELSQDSLCQEILATFAGHGIAAERLELRDWRATPDWAGNMGYYERVDIALDPIGGVSGGTTTCDALWMGVPVVTLMGDRMGGRMSAAMLHAIGCADWIAADEDDYVRIVVALANSPALRAQLRGSLRGQMQASSLCDVQGLVASIEDAFSEMVATAFHTGRCFSVGAPPSAVAT